MTDYLAGVTDERDRAALARVVEIARRLVPDAEEGMSYGMPALRLRGKALVAVVAAKTHLSLFPFSATVVAAVAPDLDGWSVSAGTIRFDADHPLPDHVVERVVLLRVDEIDARR